MGSLLWCVQGQERSECLKRLLYASVGRFTLSLSLQKAADVLKLLVPGRVFSSAPRWPSSHSRPPPLHPSFRAVNNSRRAVGLRNADMTEVLRQGMLLRCNTGRKAALQVKNRQRSQTPSIQGMWTPQLQDALSKQGAPSSA